MAVAEAKPKRARPACITRKLANADDAGASPPAQPSSADAGASISNADKVIASLRPWFRACYNAGLQVDREMEGCIVMTAHVASDGSVATADIATLDGLSDSVGACLVDVVRRATFSPPGGAGSTLRVPVTFIQAEPR